MLSSLFRPRIDRILFAATKADHLHHSSHDRLEAVLRRAVARAVATGRAIPAPAIDVVALAAVRATREAQVAARPRKTAFHPRHAGLPARPPMARRFDGNTEVATFPGDLPDDPEALFSGDSAFRGLSSAAAEKTDFRFLALSPAAARRATTRTDLRCLTSALTAPSSS